MAVPIGSADCLLDNIIQSTRLLIDHEDPKDFVSTYAKRATLKLLRRFGSILIKGISGSGKSRLGLKLLQEISDNDNRIPIVLTSFRPKYVVLIDNIFGSSNLVEARVEEWSRMFNIMLPSVECGKIFLIITSRPEILSQCEHRLNKYTLMDTMQSVSLYTGDFQLKKYEKKNIVKLCCGKKVSFSEREIEDILDIDTPIGLPQCCIFYGRSREAQAKGIHFFHKPFDYIAQEVAILQETDPLGYMILLLVALNNGCLEQTMFRPLKCTQNFRDLVETVVDICSVASKPNLKGIESKAEALCGIFLEQIQQNFQFVHQTVFDAVFLDIANRFPDRCITVCSANLLVELVRTHAQDDPQADKVVVCLERDDYFILADRIINLILSGTCLEILEHPSLHEEEFVQLMFDSLTQENKLKQFVLMKIPEESQFQEFSALEDMKTDVEPFQAKMELFHYDYILSHLILKKIGIVDLILDVFGKTVSRVLIQQLLPCAVYVNNIMMCKKLIDFGAVPDEGCVRALCGSPDIHEETPELNKLILEKLDQWDGFADVIESLICLAVDKGNISLVQMLCEKMTEGRFIRDIGQVLTFLLEMFWATNSRECTRLTDTVVENAVEAILGTGCESDMDYLAWLAASHFSSKVLNVILKKNVDVNRKYHGKTSLHQAVQYGGAECVRLLLDHGADISIRVVDKGNTVLHLAAETCVEGSSKANILCEHLKLRKRMTPMSNIKNEIYPEGTKCVNRQNYDWETPLHIASRGKDTDILKMLLKAGAIVNARNFNGDTPLHLAVDHEATSCVKILLESKASVNATNIWGCKPLNRPHNTNVDIVQILVGASSDVNYARGPVGSCLHIAVLCDDVKTMKLICSKGADVNVKNRDGQNCLMVATTYGDLDMIKYLCEQGSRADGIDNYGHSVIHTALEYETESVEELQYLLDVQHAPIDVKDNLGRTAMFPAVESGDTENVELLKDRGFHIQQVDGKGNTLLHAACGAKNRNLDDILNMLIPRNDEQNKMTNTLNSQNESGETVLNLIAKKNLDCDIQFLLKNSANPNIPDHHHRTALHYMAENGRSDYINIMLLAGADPCSTDLQSKTPLHLSADRGDYVSIKFLLKKAAEPHIADSNGRTALHYAAGREKIESVQLLLDRGADPNQLDIEGKNPLHIAIERRFSPNIKLFLERGANPCVSDNQNRTPLHLACANVNGNDYVNILLQKGANPSALDDNGRTPLQVATEKGNSECIGVLLQNGADPNIPDKRHLTALHIAAENRQIGCMRILLDNGSDLNALQKWGKSVLHIAAENGSSECISILLDRGIDPNVKDKRGRIPLHSAIDGKYSYVQLLLERGSNPSSRDKMGIALLHAAAGIEIGGEFVRLLLEGGADPNVADREGRTPLHYACLTGCSESIKLLIEAGADPNTFDRHKRTPLLIAAKAKPADLVQVLLEGGADPNVCNEHGKTPLHFAANVGGSNSVEHLLEKGANPFVTDVKDWTPLHFAGKRITKDITAMLLRKGVNVNAQNSEGQTPLHIATGSNTSDSVKILLQFEADPNLLDREHRTSLHTAVSSDNIHSVKLLLDNGAQPSLLDNLGKTPLHIAAEKLTGDCVMLLLDKGADICALDPLERSSLHIAAEKGRSDSVELLLDSGANIFAKDNKGCTPLHLTLAAIIKMHDIDFKAASKYLSTLSALIEHGSDLSVKDLEGTTPLDILQFLQMNNTEIWNPYIPSGHDQDLEGKYFGIFEHANLDIRIKYQYEQKIDMPLFIQLVADILQVSC